MESDLHDREPLSNREWSWIFVQAVVALAVWIFAVGFVLDRYVHPPPWLGDLLEFGGAIVVVLGIGWWRVLRHGEDGPPRAGFRRTWGANLHISPKGAFFLFWALFGVGMAVGALAQGNNVVRLSSVPFALLAVRYFTLYRRHRDD